MSRKNKYSRVNDVILALALEETTVEKLSKIKWQATHKGDTEYAQLIEDGIASHNRINKIDKARSLGLLPEDVLNRMEIEEEVGWRGCDKEGR